MRGKPEASTSSSSNTVHHHRMAQSHSRPGYMVTEDQHHLSTDDIYASRCPHEPSATDLAAARSAGSSSSPANLLACEAVATHGRRTDRSMGTGGHVRCDWMVAKLLIYIPGRTGGPAQHGSYSGPCWAGSCAKASAQARPRKATSRAVLARAQI